MRRNIVELKGCVSEHYTGTTGTFSFMAILTVAFVRLKMTVHGNIIVT